LYLPIPNRVKFEFNPIDYDKEFRFGNISIKAIPTPGHTLESTSFLIEEKILLTGDTLFINGVGRPDLKASTDETVQKAKLLYQSLQTLLSLNNDTIVLPSHTSQPVDFDKIPIQNTLSAIKNNVAMLKLSEPEFIITLLERIPPTPANYLSIVERNISGDLNGINPIDLEAGANRCAIA
jgi:glyoxylase-like metal-dependent hydrolase (beta-lactamase superfamily II)